MVLTRRLASCRRLPNTLQPRPRTTGGWKARGVASSNGRATAKLARRLRCLPRCRCAVRNFAPAGAPLLLPVLATLRYGVAHVRAAGDGVQCPDGHRVLVLRP